MIQETRLVSDLRPHPENEHIYGDTADSDLIESITDKGVLTPLLITFDNRIISGHRRWKAAQRAKLREVPITLFQSEDELDILEALIAANTQRNKTNEQYAREHQALLEVERERAKERQIQGKSIDPENNNLSDLTLKGYSADLVGEKTGKSGKFVQQSVAVIEAVDALKADGKEREAKQLVTTMNKSMSKAYDIGREAGYIETRTARPAMPQTRSNHFSLKEWQGMSAEEKDQAVQMRSKSAKFNSQKDDNIEWALWSWNPVTGCKHNCPYCYARDIAMHYQSIYPNGFEPTFIPERLDAPFNTTLPKEAETNIGYKNVFTCSMADLFGRWVPAEWIHAVLDTIALAPQWNFLFLTKFPIRLAEFDFPDNAWVGTTVDCQARVKNAEEAFSRVNAKVKWLSCEPLLEPLEFSDLSMFQWIVLGGSSRSSQTPEWRPPRAWINEIEYKAHQAGCMVYEKTNLLERVREYPFQMNGDAHELPEALKYLPGIE